MSGDDHALLCGLMEQAGGAVRHLAPENILLMAQAGSHLYDLATSTSDVDFVVIYREPTQVTPVPELNFARILGTNTQNRK